MPDPISLTRLSQLDQEASPPHWSYDEEVTCIRSDDPNAMPVVVVRDKYMTRDNAALIVAMREALPALLELAEAANDLPRCSCGMPEYTRRFDEATAAFSFDEEQS